MFDIKAEKEVLKVLERSHQKIETNECIAELLGLLAWGVIGLGQYFGGF